MDTATMPRWQEGDSALRVAIGNAATSFAEERMSVREAAEVLRALAGARTDLLASVALDKLRAYVGRGFADQVTEMHAAAALLRAHVGI